MPATTTSATARRDGRHRVRGRRRPECMLPATPAIAAATMIATTSKWPDLVPRPPAAIVATEWLVVIQPDTDSAAIAIPAIPTVPAIRYGAASRQRREYSNHKETGRPTQH